MQQVDVVVVGGGLSGLYSALTLQSYGLRVVVLEARSRVGGLTYSPMSDVLQARLDMGGQWVGSTNKRMLELVRRYSVPFVRQYVEGDRIRLHGQDVYRGPMGSVPGLKEEELLEQASSVKRLQTTLESIETDVWKSSDAPLLDSMTFSSWVDFIAIEAKSNSVKAWLKRMPSAYYGAPADEISALDTLYKIKMCGGPIFQSGVGTGAQEYLLRGSALVSEGMAEQIGNVVLSAPVRQIRWQGDGVQVHTPVGAWAARYMICAMAPAMISQIAFDPPLPASRRQLHQRSPIGRYTKVKMIYDQPFWRQDGLSGNVLSTDGSVGSMFDMGDNSSDYPVLAATFGGVSATAIDKLSPQARKARVLELVSRALGPKATDLVAYHEQIWANEEWSGGASSAFTTPGAITAAAADLRVPCGPIHWAGTQLAQEYPGYMEGALAAGEKAARDIVTLEDIRL